MMGINVQPQQQQQHHHEQQQHHQPQQQPPQQQPQQHMDIYGNVAHGPSQELGQHMIQDILFSQQQQRHQVPSVQQDQPLTLQHPSIVTQQQSQQQQQEQMILSTPLQSPQEHAIAAAQQAMAQQIAQSQQQQQQQQQRQEQQQHQGSGVPANVIMLQHPNHVGMRQEQGYQPSSMPSHSQATQHQPQQQQHNHEMVFIDESHEAQRRRQQQQRQEIINNEKVREMDHWKKKTDMLMTHVMYRRILLLCSDNNR